MATIATTQAIIMDMVAITQVTTTVTIIGITTMAMATVATTMVITIGIITTTLLAMKTIFTGMAITTTV